VEAGRRLLMALLQQQKMGYDEFVFSLSTQTQLAIA
jgi:hypothetical protein